MVTPVSRAIAQPLDSARTAVMSIAPGATHPRPTSRPGTGQAWPSHHQAPSGECAAHCMALHVHTRGTAGVESAHAEPAGVAGSAQDAVLGVVGARSAGTDHAQPGILSRA